MLHNFKCLKLFSHHSNSKTLWNIWGILFSRRAGTKHPWSWCRCWWAVQREHGSVAPGLVWPRPPAALLPRAVYFMLRIVALTLCTSPSVILGTFHLSFLFISLFLDLLPRKQTWEQPLLVQDEDKLKKQEIPTETAFPRPASEATPPKVSIAIPEEQKSLKKCHLYSSLFPSPRIPFMMSFLLVIALTVWWLLFLWVATGSCWNLKTKAPEFLGCILCCIFLVLVFDLHSSLSQGGTPRDCCVNPALCPCVAVMGPGRSGCGFPGPVWSFLWCKSKFFELCSQLLWEGRWGEKIMGEESGFPSPWKTSHRNCWRIAFKFVVLNVRYSQAEEHLTLM